METGRCLLCDTPADTSITLPNGCKDDGIPLLSQR